MAQSINDYEMRGETGIIFLGRKDGTRIETQVDAADLFRVIAYGRWCAQWIAAARSFYVTARISGRKKIGLAPFILGIRPPLVADHLNHDTLDNRRSNLRPCTQSDNMLNRLASRNNTSGFRGVTWSKELCKWRAKVRIRKQLFHLGYFLEKEQAARAVREKLISEQPAFVASKQA